MNVGVIVMGDDGFAARFIGEDDTGKIDGRSLPRALGGSETYKAWVTFVRKEAERRRLDERVERLRRRPDNYLLERCGEIWDEAWARDPASCANELFKELVGEPRPHEKSVDELAEETLSEIRLPYGHRIERDVPIGIEIKGVRRSYTFDYRYQHGATTLMEKLSLRDSAKRSETRVNDLLFRIDNVGRATSIDDFVVMYVPGGAEWERQVNLIEKYANTVDLTETESASNLAAAMGVPVLSV
ncbi:hypothetical protein GCM10009785_35190 [Brooklawnia cerclae]